MKRKGFVAAAAAFAIAIGTVGIAAPAAAAPPTAPWGGSAGGEVASLTTTAVGLTLADLGVAVSEAESGSTLTPRSSSVSSNVSADVAGIGIAVVSNDQIAPPDAGGPESGTLLGVDVLGLLEVGALTTTNEAHWDVDTACVTDGVLAAATTQTAGLSLLPLLGGGVLSLGVSQTTGETSLVQNTGLNYGVESVATGSITGLSLLGGAITVEVAGDTTLTATATGTSTGTVDYAPATVTVTGPAGSVVLTPGADIEIGIPLVADVTITMNEPSITTTATSATATSSLLSIDVSVLGIFPLPPVAAVSVDVLPLSASATAPAGGIDCPPAPPVITTPAAGATTNATPDIAGTAEPNATVEVVVDGASIGTTTADADGNWTITSPALTEGEHVATAVQTVAGTPSATSAPVAFVVDATAPAPPVISAPSDGDLLTDSTPAISGTAEPLSTVEVFVDGTSIGTTPADGDGNWSLTPATALADGSHTAVATATDAAGNTSGASDAVTFAIDATPPGAPVIITPVNGSTTTDTTPLFSGTAEAGTDVTVIVDGTAIGTTTVDGSGNWTLTPAVPLSQGAHTATATATDAAGNVSPQATAVGFTIDSVAPVAPVITGPVEGSTTSDPTPLISGTAEPDTTLTVIIDDAAVGTTPVDGLGNWTFTPAAPLADGAHSVTATTTDAAGNVSPEATPVSFTVDTVGPAAPVIISPADGSSTNDTTPPIAGTAEPDSTVEVFVDGTSIGTTTADADGNWSVTPATPLAEGAHTATATATDAGGTVSPESAAVAFTVDLTPPAAPAVVTPADGSLTNDTTPPISGTAEPGATVNVRIDGAVVGTTLADGSGAWTFTPATALAEGAHTVSATATDAAGNTGPISNTNTFTVDSVAPAAPVVTAPADGSSTADATPTITGTAEPNTTVTVTIDGAELGTAPVDALGNWTLTPATPLGDGEHTVTATATDAAGNESGPSAPVSFTVDTTGPAAPVITSPADGSTTNDDTPPITGTAEPGSIVTIVIDGTEVGAAETDESGDWTFQPTTPLTEGDHTVIATATDDAGNTGPAASVDFTVDTTPPAAPVITSPADGSATDDSTPPITGTAEPGSEVTVIVDGDPVGTTTADEDGNWTFTPATPLTDGEHVITATATDAAGNAGPASTPLTLRIGSGATAAPGVLPVTGGGSPLIAAFAGALMVALGAGLIGSRRRRA